MANGDCYAANGREIIGADDSARLVHGVGILQTDGKPFGHCWVEKGGKCIDKSNGNNIKFPKQLYYPEQVSINVLKHKHWGPWDLKPPR